MATEDKQYLCKYQVAALIFMTDEDKIIMDPTNILSIEILDDYEFNIRTALKISLRMDIRKKIWILKNKRDISCKFQLDCLGMDSEGEEYNMALESVYDLKSCGIYLSDDDEAIDVKLLEDELALNNSGQNVTDRIDDEDYFESQNLLTVYLFEKELLNASTKTYNEVFRKDTLQQMVARMITETKHPRVLMCPFENTKQYSEVLIPALPVHQGIIYLDQYYGLYKTGALIYYDVNRLYIINTNGRSIVKEQDEWPETNILVSRNSEAAPGNGMTRKPNEKVFYCNIPESQINPQMFTISNNVDLGSEAKIVITDDVTIQIDQADQSYMDQRNQFIQRISKADNQYTLDIMIARMEENECIMYITGDSFDIRAFTPNKKFLITFKEASKQLRYGFHKYRLAYAYHYIHAESQGYMSSTHKIVLKKCVSDHNR